MSLSMVDAVCPFRSMLFVSPGKSSLRTNDASGMLASRDMAIALGAAARDAQGVSARVAPVAPRWAYASSVRTSKKLNLMFSGRAVVGSTSRRGVVARACECHW